MTFDILEYEMSSVFYCTLLSWVTACLIRGGGYPHIKMDTTRPKIWGVRTPWTSIDWRPCITLCRISRRVWHAKFKTNLSSHLHAARSEMSGRPYTVHGGGLNTA